MELPTTPIGKQQIIDIKAGAILRNNRKKAQLLGCSSKLSVILILLVKCAMIITWLVREYETFPNGCEFLSNGFNTEFDEEFIENDERERRHVDLIEERFENEWTRVKRSITPIEKLDPRARTGKHRKIDREKLQSTVVTMTNTQELLTSNDVKVKMKTIRSRLESVQTNPNSSDNNDENTLEIDLLEEEPEDEGPPVIYMAPIINRRTNQADPLPEKPKKRKGKGRKKDKKNKMNQIEEGTVLPAVLVVSEVIPEPVKLKEEKKKKGKGRKGKNKKEKEKLAEESRSTTRLPHTEQTKSVRHLFSPPASIQTTTMNPHNTNFLHGVFDPKDPKFSNKGEIRIYPMHPANKKPKPSMKLSKETRMMWEMDEANFTTHMSPKIEDEPKQQESVDLLQSLALFPLPRADSEALPPTTTEQPPKRDFYSTHKVATWAKKEDRPTSRRPTTTTMAPEEVYDEEEPTSTQQVAIYYETVKEPAPPKLKVKTMTTLEQLEADMEPVEISTSRPLVIKHGFDRGQDELIDSMQLNYPFERTTIPPTDPTEGHRFQDQLTAFTSSAVCFIRSMLDIWCILQVLFAIPYFAGVCLSRRGLYVPHFVLDIIFVVIGFVFSITAIVFSIILFAIVDEMSKTTLFWWLIFAFVLDVLLVLYGLSIYYSIRICEQLVLDRKSLKTPPRSNSYHSYQEQGALL